MGTEVHSKRSFEGYYSMRDVNEVSNGSSWPLFYGDKALSNGHYYNGFVPRTISDVYPGCDKDVLKQKMLEHEAIFKNQVYELHRLYRRQRDMMEEIKRKEYHKHRISVEASSSSSLLPSQKPYEDAHKWQIPSFPLPNSTSAKTSIFGADISNTSPLSCSKGNKDSKDCEVVECRPSKVRKKLFDLELPPDENIDHEEHEQIQYKQESEESTYKATSFGKCVHVSNGLADLNEPLHVEEGITRVYGLGPSAKPTASPFLGQAHERFEKARSGHPSGMFNPSLLGGNGNGRDWLSSARETGNSRSNKNFTPGTYSETATRIQDHPHLNQTPLPFTASRASTSYPYTNSSDLGNSWGKPNGSLTHKLTSFPKQPSFLPSPHNHVVFGDKWRVNGCYPPNGFNHGSSSGYKNEYARPPSNGFDNRTRDNLDDRLRKIDKSSHFIDLTDNNRGMDLNSVETAMNDDNGARKCGKTMLPWLQTKPVICKNESKCDQSKTREFDHQEKRDSVANNGKILGFLGFGNSCVSRNDSSLLASTSASLSCARENEIVKTGMKQKGFDINVAWDDPGNNQIDLESCDVEKETENEKIKNHFDLNSCVTENADFLVPESVKSSGEKVKKMTMEIDLEAPAVPEADEVEEAAIDEVKNLNDSDDEDESLSIVAAKAVVAMSSQQGQVGQTSEVAVQSDDTERLRWFADVIKNPGSIGNELDEYEELTLQLEETKEEDYMPKPLGPDFREPDEVGPSLPARPRRGQARRGRPRRDFQRDILPGLVSLSRHEVTEDLQVFGGLMKATGHSWNVGVARRAGTRGRRKSVTVAVEPPPPPPPFGTPPPPPPLSVEVVGLEERSLTGWGKTTRRPRRQRCAAGSSVMAVPLT